MSFYYVLGVRQSFEFNFETIIDHKYHRTNSTPFVLQKISGAFTIYELTNTVMRHANSIGKNRNLGHKLKCRTARTSSRFENVICPEGAPYE